MSDFTQLIQLRNSGKSQEEIAQILGISRRSIIRYLKEGKIPIYSRMNKSNRLDPIQDFWEEIKSKLELNPKIELTDLFNYLKALGYSGSERTLRRKTRNLRLELKVKEVFFQREVLPGDVIEGDFTEIHIDISGHQRRIYLWVSSLPYSNCYFATPYYHCNFECFADGTVKSFNEFGGIAKKYRLDNMSVAVKKILMGKNRLVTTRYSELQNHYGFAQDFCNPGRGNEKGNVEANNRFLKKKILSSISLTKQKFINLKAFEMFVAQLCRDHNKTCQTKFIEEKLSPLPTDPFYCFRTEIVGISKYSLFSIDSSGHLYSAPSKYLGLNLEIRIYPDRIDAVKDGEIVCSHPRLYGPRGLVSIMPEHVISALVKKPGAMSSWKHRHILFDRPAWKKFYDKLIENGGKDKDYLKCLQLMSDYGREIVTVAMELAMESDIKLNNKELKKIIINDLDKIHELRPIRTNLNQYDFFLKGEMNGS